MHSWIFIGQLIIINVFFTHFIIALLSILITLFSSFLSIKKCSIFSTLLLQSRIFFCDSVSFFKLDLDPFEDSAWAIEICNNTQNKNSSTKSRNNLGDSGIILTIVKLLSLIYPKIEKHRLWFLCVLLRNHIDKSCVVHLKCYPWIDFFSCVC